MSAYISTASDTAAGTFDRVQLASLSAQRRRLPFPKRAAVAILLRRAPPLPQPADAICRPRNSAAGIRDAGSASASCGGRCGGGDSSDGSRNECEERLEMLFILRAKNERDRWSGQVACPASYRIRLDFKCPEF